MVVTLIEAHFLSASCNVGLKHHGLLTFFNGKGFPIQKILNIFVNQTVLVKFFNLMVKNKLGLALTGYHMFFMYMR